MPGRISKRGAGSMDELEFRLTDFRRKQAVTAKGALCVVLVVTRLAKKKGLPLDPKTLITPEKGQVLGLGKGAVQAILSDYGITRVLAEEGGRTSRGSMGHMERYVEFLNALHARGLFDPQKIERWWIGRVKEYFSEKGFVLSYDASKSMRSIVEDLLAQASKREASGGGTTYAGAMLQHLVGAKLALVLPKAQIEHKGYSVSDSASGRDGDFALDDVVIHVTTAPTEALLRKCRRNLDSGTRPILVTTAQGQAGAQSLASVAEIGNRVDIVEAAQFIAMNLYELSLFQSSQRKLTIERLVDRYNQIVGECETDPALRIAFAR